MAKIIGGLFGEDTKGTIAGMITFRTRNGKTETLRQSKTIKPPSPAQIRIRTCYSAAHAAWVQLPKQYFLIGKHYVHRRDPNWPTYWNQWLQDHPGCQNP